MSEPVQTHTGSLPLALERQVDRLCDEFEDGLRRGITPDLDACLAQIDDSARRQLLGELMKLLRSYAAGEAASRYPGQQNSSAQRVDAGKHDSAGQSVGSTTRMQVQRSIEAWEHLDEDAARFQKALDHGELLRIEGLVASAARETRHKLLRELLRLEMGFRSKRGDMPSLEDYRARFPDHGRLVKYLYFENFVPVRIGEFSIQRLLGSGGFGHVYQGWDSKLSRNVAIKVFRRDPDVPAPPGGLLFEARTAAQLHHPGIVTVYGILPDADGDEFLVLEYVDGKSLEALLHSSRLFAHEAATLVLAVVQALQHSHQHGLVHRDLKPANILLDQGRSPRVTDFGLALHLTDLRRSPEVAGTLPYMAPEQARGETHRLDARTDLWAVGVTLYRMLAGELPFSAAGRQELLEAICHQEPLDLSHRDPTIPPEMARIVRRCLAKQMSERYQSAAELADDLRAFLNPAKELQTGESAADLMSSALAVVPKGLRCFDANDREFFLGLVPGPRDREGIPQGVRFWQQRLQELDANQTFRVGLLYGPSGCGKSSLVRAGILPRLPGNVRRIVIESSRNETESRLIGEIRRHFPGMPADLTLPSTLAELREGSWLHPGEKLVIVFDQLEQWLHGWQHDSPATLVEALRQCDGGRVQALALVRDDFWMPATRLFQRLDIALVEGFNASAVDLFDRSHAIKILAAFGVAYGRLGIDPSRRTLQEQEFLEQAVDELAEDGWLVPVRLCIFAEMVKARKWSPETLREVGGTRGLGAAFLEEVFDSRLASPMHRLHREAARLALERLLPPPGTDIRGHLVPEDELRSATGYNSRPADFMALMHCLDQELRLITPSDAGLSSEANESDAQSQTARFYQLTHDYLVTAIRDWLNQTRRRTLRGRAELRLAEYAGAYAARAESRQLPSWWEWLSIVALTRPKRWGRTGWMMMRAATRRYITRAGLGAAVIIFAGAIIYDRMATIRADGLVQALATTDSRDMSSIVERIRDSARWARPRLTEQLAETHQMPDQRARFLLGALAAGDANVDELGDHLLTVEPWLVIAIADALRRYGGLEELESRLLSVANDRQAARGRRLRACVGLSRLDSVSDAVKWSTIGDDIADLLVREVTENPRFFDLWVEGLEPARKWLAQSLRQSFANPKLTAGEQVLVAEILVRYTSDDTPKLVELALLATPQQFDILATGLKDHAALLRNQLASETAATIPADATEQEKDRLARRRANVILLLHQLDDDRHLWASLQNRPDPRLRSYLLHHFRENPTAVDWIQHLSHERDPGILQATILILANSASEKRIPELPADVYEELLRIYRQDADSGVHSAAHWALQTLGLEKMLAEALVDLSKLGMRSGYRWYVTKSRITMIIVEPPGDVLLGSPENETGRDASDEHQWKCRVDWGFAISATEITQALFADLCPDYTERFNDNAPEPDCPANAISWLEAQQFCRLLSEHDNIPESEMTFPAPNEARKYPYPDFLSRTGYRLPTEVEWEVACRAGTNTCRFYGNDPDLLGYYACYIGNSGGRSWTVGHGWPNAFGFFDMLGNVAEWCQDVYIAHPESRSQATAVPLILPIARMSIRGNEYASTARTIRAANRRFGMASEASSYARGFRIAHSIRQSQSTD